MPTDRRHRPRVCCLVLAGGQGSRLGPLTEGRSKPSLRVGGHYRLIDIALSNIANSGLSDVFVVEQFEPHLLNEHLAGGRPWDLDRSVGGLRVLPPYESADDGDDADGFASGNADALWRSAAVIDAAAPDVLVVASADHLYRLDLRDVLDRHVEAAAAVTVVATDTDDDPSRYTVVEVDGDRVVGLAYKPDDPAGRTVATEVFAYDWPALRDRLGELAADDEPMGDYGDRLLPSFLDDGGIAAHRLEGFWADLGVPAAYLDVQLAVLDGSVDFAFDDPAWPIRSADTLRRPACIHASASVDTGWVSSGASVAGRVERSVLGPGVVVEAGAVVVDSVLLDDVVVGADAEVRRTVAAEGARVAPGARVGGPDGDPVLIGARATVDAGEPVAAGAQVAGGAVGRSDD